jgi:nitrogen fixation NifU-like protein
MNASPVYTVRLPQAYYQETAKNKTVEKIKNFATQANNSFDQSKNSFEREWKEFNKIMGKNNISRKECLLLPVKTTLDALKINRYEY